MSGHKKYLSVALLSAVLLPAMASAADAPATFTPEQEAKIGKIAADYLVAHPEVLLQASQKLQQIQAEQQASAATQAVLKNAAVLTQDKNTPTYGPANGKVTVIEFFDYQCVYCSRLAPVVGITITPGVPLRPISCARSLMLCSTGSTSAAFFASKPAFFACCWISAVVSLPSLWPVA